MQKRLRKLEAELCDISLLETSLHAALRKSGALEMEQINLAYMYHLLPDPDAPPLKVLYRVVNQLNKPNKVNQNSFRKFMNYVKASDVVKFTKLSGGSIKPVCEEGYDLMDKEWYKSCCSGNSQLPLAEEWGKCWMENVLNVQPLIYTWYMTAGDVTRAIPDISTYDSQMTKVAQRSNMTNELLYTLDHAPYLDKWLPKDVVKAISNGKTPWDKVADMSIKSENTKFGAKMRETWSADAITRELLTEYDFSLIPIERLYEGVTSRRSANEIARIFDRINKYTVGDTYGVICSNDTSG
ncbi:unnamed protein product [Gordionus sp. m RMFG-2023]